MKNGHWEYSVRSQGCLLWDTFVEICKFPSESLYLPGEASPWAGMVADHHKCEVASLGPPVGA